MHEKKAGRLKEGIGALPQRRGRDADIFKKKFRPLPL